MKTFAGIDKKFADFNNASVLLQSIPYDGTSTWGKGAYKGFDAFINASENMELYDIETDQEVCWRGIHILPVIQEKTSPESVFNTVRKRTIELLKTDKFLTFFGGEHSISIRIIDAFEKKYKNLTVLQLDAHADLRESYLGSQYNHACAMHQANKNTNLIQVGIRSMDISEKQHLKLENCFFAKDINDRTDWIDKAINLMTDEVYLSIDLDALDPSIMPATGTPEPGGLSWYQTLNFLRQVFAKKKVVCFDIVEFAPIEKLLHPDFLVAKLYYKLLSYKFENERYRNGKRFYA